MYKNPAIKSREYPTLTQTLKAIKKLDNDERDVRDYMSLALHLSEVSPRLRGHILTRRTGVLAYEWELSKFDKNYDITKVFARLKPAINHILEHQVSTPLFGLTLHDLEWVQSQNGLAPKLKYRNNVEVDFDEENVYIVDELGNKNVLEQGTYLFESDGFNLRGGIMRSLLLNVILAHELELDWFDLAKRMKGIISTAYNPEELKTQTAVLGLNDQDTQKLYDDVINAMTNLNEGNWLMTLKAFETKLNSLVDSGASSAYQILMNELNNSIAIGILGQANTSQLPSGGGSRAALQVLNLIRTDILYYDMLRCKALVDELIKRDFEVNVRTGDIPIEFNWVYDDNSDILTYANTFEVLARMNVPVLKSEFYNKLALTAPQEDDDLLFINSSAAPII